MSITDTVLGGGTLTYFTDTSLMMVLQKVSHITGWDEAASQLETWILFCDVFLINVGGHSATFVMFTLVEDMAGVSPQLRAQALQKSAFPTALLRLIQMDSNKSFC